MDRRHGIWLGAITGFGAVALAACGGGGKPSGTTGTGGAGTDAGAQGGAGPGPSTIETIGPSGGTLSLAGATLQIPAGALLFDVAVSFRVATGTRGPVDTPPAGPIFEIGPDDTFLLLPAKLTLPWSPDNQPADAVVTVFTAPSGGLPTDFLPVETTAEDATHVSVTTTHFSTWGPYWDRSSSSGCAQSVCGATGLICLKCGLFPLCVAAGSKCCGDVTCAPDRPVCLDCRATGGKFYCEPEANNAFCCNSSLPCGQGLDYCLSCPNNPEKVCSSQSTCP